MLGSRFTMLLTASTVSNIGDGVLLAALPLLARRLSTDPVTVSSVSVAATLPWLLFGLLAGVVVDRVDRRRLMVGTDMARAAAVAVVASAVALDAVSIPLLLVAVFALGIAESLFDTAAQAFVPSIVDAEHLETANGRLFGAQIAANSFVGPPLGAALFTAAATAPFGLDAVSFLVSAAMLAALRGAAPNAMDAPPRRSVRAEIREGLAWLWHDQVVRAFAIGAAVVNVAHTSVMAVVVLFVRDELHASSLGFGLALAGAAVGGVAGTQLAPLAVDRLGRRRAVLAAMAAFAAALVVAGASTTVWLASAGLALFGVAGEVWNVVAVSYRQARVPDRLLGRVMASYRVIAYGAMPIGAALGGVLAKAFGLRAPFVAGAVLVTALLLYFGPATAGTPLDERAATRT